MVIDALVGHNCMLTTLNYGVESVRSHLIRSALACIERGVWLRDNVTLLSRMTIAVDAIVPVASVAMRNVPASVVIGGVPAKKLQNL